MGGWGDRPMLQFFLGPRPPACVCVYQTVLHDLPPNKDINNYNSINCIYVCTRDGSHIASERMCYLGTSVCSRRNGRQKPTLLDSIGAVKAIWCQSPWKYSHPDFPFAKTCCLNVLFAGGCVV